MHPSLYLNSIIAVAAAPSIPTASAAGASVPSQFELTVEGTSEFLNAESGMSIPLADFLRKLDLSTNIYGADTELIKKLSTNTTKHEKAKIKVWHIFFCVSYL